MQEALDATRRAFSNAPKDCQERLELAIWAISNGLYKGQVNQLKDAVYYLHVASQDAAADSTVAKTKSTLDQAISKVGEARASELHKYEAQANLEHRVQESDSAVQTLLESSHGIVQERVQHAKYSTEAALHKGNLQSLHDAAWYLYDANQEAENTGATDTPRRGRLVPASGQTRCSQRPLGCSGKDNP